jgi:hypothetical protein
LHRRDRELDTLAAQRRIEQADTQPDKTEEGKFNTLELNQTPKDYISIFFVLFVGPYSKNWLLFCQPSRFLAHLDVREILSPEE